MGEAATFYRRVLSSIGTQSAGLILGFIGSIILARTLGPEGRGVVAWFVSLNIIASTMTQLGMPQVNAKLAAGDPKSIPVLYALTVKLALVMSLVVIPIAWFVASQNAITNELGLALGVVLVGVPILSVADSLAGLFLGMHRSKAFNITMISQKVVGVGAVVIAMYLEMLTPTSAVVLLMLAVLAKFLIAVWQLRPLKWTGQDTTALFKTSKPFIMLTSVAMLASLVTSHGIVLLLGLLANVPAEIGYFAVSYTLIEALGMIPRVMGMYVLPHLVSLSTAEEKQRFKKQAALLLFGFMSTVCATLWVVAPFLVPLLFGDAFADAVPIFQILLIGSIGFSGFRLFHSILVAENNGFIIVLAPCVSAIVAAVAAFLTFDDGGAHAAAYTWLAANAVAMLVSAILLFVRRS